MNTITNKTRLGEKKKAKLQKRKLIRRINESNRVIKQNERRQKRENMVEDNDIGRFFELATNDSIYVNNLNLHEITNEILLNYVGAFEMVGNSKVGDQIRKTNIRFKNMVDFEAYINSIDEDYDAEDAIFNGHIYKINTPQFNKVNRSQYENGCSFDKRLVEYRGNNCFIPTQGNCFVKCINFLTGQDYKQKYLDFIRSEQRRSNIMTKATIQPFCRANNINLGYYDDDGAFPRTVTKRNSALYLKKNHFCLIWKSQGVSFNQTIQDLKDNFKIVDNYITEENVKSHFKYEYKPKKIESHLTNFIVYDIETYNTVTARPYVFSFYRLSKLAGRYNRDLTPSELEKCREDTIAFEGNDCVEKA